MSRASHWRRADPGLSVVASLVAVAVAGAESPALVLPTDNDALLRGRPAEFYMFVDRIFEKQVSTPWEGGRYGFVRGPVRVGTRVAHMHFHEGLDIAAVRRDAAGEPLDEVRSIMTGVVAHCSEAAGASNYGRYVVVRHDLAEGPFYSLYAHLSRILVKPGERVAAGRPLGIMGHTGSGIDRRRSHVHVELNLFLHSRFCDWHDLNFRDSPNKHDVYNGLNLAGLDLAGLYLARQKEPDLGVAAFLKRTEPGFKVLVPRRGRIELLSRYRWLWEGPEAASPSLELVFSGGGLPLAVRPAAVVVAEPRASWVRDEGLPVSYCTRGYLSGSASKFALTASGLRYIQLITGEFGAAPAARVPAK